MIAGCEWKKRTDFYDIEVTYFKNIVITQVSCLSRYISSAGRVDRLNRGELYRDHQRKHSTSGKGWMFLDKT